MREYRLLFALGTGPCFGLILNPKRNTEFSVTKAKISHVYLCVSLCRHTSTLKEKKCMQVFNWLFHLAIKISVTFQ